MEFRKVFDTIPEQFDKYRPRYSAELFAELIEYAEIGPGKSVLELGPGTGQATDPIVHTGCDYNAIELGENLFAMMLMKYIFQMLYIQYIPNLQEEQVLLTLDMIQNNIFRYFPMMMVMKLFVN